MPDRRPLPRGEIIGQRVDREHRIRRRTGVCSARRRVVTSLMPIPVSVPSLCHGGIPNLR
jgi:hypothetical protein